MKLIFKTVESLQYIVFEIKLRPKKSDTNFRCPEKIVFYLCLHRLFYRYQELLWDQEQNGRPVLRTLKGATAMLGSARDQNKSL